MGTDYSAWGKDSLKFRHCINSSIQPCSELSKFPIGYLANSFLIEFLKNYGFQTGLSFVLINLLFLSLPIFFLFTTKKSKEALNSSFIYITCLLITPIPSFYIYSGGLEIQAGVVIGLFLSSFILYIQSNRISKNNHIIFFLYISAFLFPLYKDVFLITIALSLFFSLFIYFYFFKKSNFRNILTFNSQIFFLILILIFSFFCSIFYNFFKYQSLTPLAYIHEASVSSPTKIKSLEFLIASLLSPNGGILIFWFSSFFVCFLLIHTKRHYFSNLTLLTSCFLFSGTVIGLALWWAPFGWDSWGNRLIVPTMLGILISLISTASFRDSFNRNNFSSPTETTYYSIFTHKFFFTKIILVSILIFSFHYVLVSYYSDKSKLLRESLLNHPSCLEMMDAFKREGQNQGFAFWRSDYYYTCARDRFLHIPTFWKQF